MTAARDVQHRFTMTKGAKHSVIEALGSLDIVRSYHRVKQQNLSPNCN